MSIAQLKTALPNTMADSASGSDPLGERAALEAALDVASEWKMRLDEIESEEGEPSES